MARSSEIRGTDEDRLHVVFIETGTDRASDMKLLRQVRMRLRPYRFGLKPRTRSTNIYGFIFIRGGLYHKPGGFLRSPRQVDCINL